MKLLDKGYVISMIIIAVASAFVGMVAGNMGSTSLAIGACITSCMSAMVVVIYGLIQWKK